MWFIMLITYGTLFGYMTLINVQHPALAAVVPTVGFNLSTWSLPFLKILWIQFQDQERAKQEKSTTSIPQLQLTQMHEHEDDMEAGL